jgi:hypothetical protein
MDQKRYEELVTKRETAGLTREEADELGRLMAEMEGRRYSNADAQDHTDDSETTVRRDDRSFPGPKSEAPREAGSSGSDRG